jgi:hypothetical protein
MAFRETKETYRRLVDLDLIRRALVEAGDLPLVVRAKTHLDEIVRYRIGDKIEYEKESGKWVAGVVVAFMVCEPMYVCGEGDDRDTVGEKLLGCQNSHVRSRAAKSS